MRIVWTTVRRPEPSNRPGLFPKGTKTIKTILRLFKQTFIEWRRHNAALLAAGIAYFTVFSLAPLLIIAIALVGFFLGPAAAEGEIVTQMSRFMGSELALTIQKLVANARESGMGKATIFSAFMLALGASAIFGQLQTALNMIWDAEAQPGGGWRRFLKNRLLLFAMVLCIGAVLLAFFISNTMLGVLQEYFAGVAPWLAHASLWRAVNFTAQFAVVGVLAAVIFKFLPAEEISWKDAWVGAGMTSLLLAIGIHAIGVYFQNINFKSVYGVAASVVGIFIWIYLSAQIFFMGAEFTWVYANSCGSRARTPDPGAPRRRKGDVPVPAGR